MGRTSGNNRESPLSRKHAQGFGYGVSQHLKEKDGGGHISLDEVDTVKRVSKIEVLQATDLVEGLLGKGTLSH